MVWLCGNGGVAVWWCGVCSVKGDGIMVLCCGGMLVRVVVVWQCCGVVIRWCVGLVVCWSGSLMV